MNSSQLDPVSVAIALASILFGPHLAAIIGPYAVILISATVGAAWALGLRDPCSLSAPLPRSIRHNIQPASAGFFTPGDPSDA